MLLYFVFSTLATSAFPPHPDTAPKPIDKMGFGDLLAAGVVSLSELAKLENMHANPHVIRLNGILSALSRTLPLVNYDESISGVERQADGLIHDLFHPIQTAENGLRGAYWDAQHLTSDRSSFNLLAAILVGLSLYIIVGACIMAKYYDARGIDQIPHLSFWMAYPGLVIDGIVFVADSIGFDITSGSYQRLQVLVNNKSVGSRDTFSQFEPI